MSFRSTASLVLRLAIAAARCVALGTGADCADYPAIASVLGTGDPVVAERTFEFKGEAATGGVTIDRGTLAGARAGKSEVTVRGRVPEAEWIAGAHRARILDPAQDRFYGDLLGRFREIRDRRVFDGDRYLELVAAAVQQIPYVSAPGTAAKYPVETWADGSGDCDDEVLLFAGFLARGGIPSRSSSSCPRGTWPSGSTARPGTI